MNDYILRFDQIGMKDIERVGGKNCSLGELFNEMAPLGVGVLDGFAVTVAAYRALLGVDGLGDRIAKQLEGLDVNHISELTACGDAIREMMLRTPLPDAVALSIRNAYADLCARMGVTCGSSRCDRRRPPRISPARLSPASRRRS